MSRARGPWAALRAAAADRQSGSAQIAGAAAGAVADLPADEAWKALQVVLAGHPSMAALWRLAEEVLSAKGPANGADRFARLLESDEAAGAALARSLPPWVLTISYSSSVLGCLRQARIRLVTCMESLPGGEGHRTAEAVAEWARSRVIADEEALRLVPAAAVVVGSDAVAPDGLVNKVKTRALAEAARTRGVPCYAVAGFAKFVPERLPVDPPFEVTPLGLFDGIATPEGLLAPAEAADRAAQASLHPNLLAFLDRLRGRPDAGRRIGSS